MMASTTMSSIKVKPRWRREGDDGGFCMVSIIICACYKIAALGFPTSSDLLWPQAPFGVLPH
jgi:hypothetical protein